MDEILAIAFLILLNGFFAMSEIALISARRSNLQAEANSGNKGAKKALDLSSDPDRFLSAIQIGITLIGILTGIFSGNRIAADLAGMFVKAGMSASFALPLSKAVIVVIVTFLTLIFGELVPKRIGMSASEKVAKFVAGPMKFLSAVASPLVWVLSKTTRLISNILHVHDQEAKITEEEIKSIIQEGTDEGEVLPLEQDIVENVFALGDLKVSAIMTLQDDIVWLEADMGEAEVRKIIEDTLFEEYPVLDDDGDVTGILSLKDFVVNIGKPDFNLAGMMREPVYFHENMSVYKVLEEMKQKKVSRALVCDEFGSCTGIITLKDIMEALIGNMNDDSQKEPDILLRKDGESWLVAGQCSIYDFLRHFDIDDDFLQETEFTTVAGLILEELEHVPQTGETVEWKDFIFEVVDMDGARIDKLIVKKRPNASAEREAE